MDVYIIIQLYREETKTQGTLPKIKIVILRIKYLQAGYSKQHELFGC